MVSKQTTVCERGRSVVSKQTTLVRGRSVVSKQTTLVRGRIVVSKQTAICAWGDQWSASRPPYVRGEISGQQTDHFDMGLLTMISAVESDVE